MRILVTGGAGYVGSHTVKMLLTRGHEITVVDDLSTGRVELLAPEARFLQCSITDREALTGALETGRIEAVLHFAARALVGPDRDEPEEYYRVNVGGTLALVEAMIRAHVGRLVFSSTCAIYAPTDGGALTEEAPRGPVSVYGETKLAMENLVRACGERHGLAWTAFRYFNAAGAAADGSIGEWHEPETHLIPRLVQAALSPDTARRRVTIYGTDYPTPDGTAIRDYVHVDDIALAHVMALERAALGAFNLGTGSGASVNEIIARVERAAGVTLARESAPRRSGDAAVLVANNARAARELGWRPLRGLDEIVASALAWEKRRAVAG